MKYDVVVVGLNPSGCFTIKALSEYGLKVLAVDKREVLGFPVECGELLPTPSEMRGLFPKCRPFFDLFKVEPQFVSNELNYMEMVTPQLTSFKIPFKANILDRDRWVQDLAEDAENQGIEVWKGAKVQAIEFNQAQGINSIKLSDSKGHIEAKIVVGADGVNSTVARSLGFNRDVVRATALQYLMTDCDCDSDVGQMFLGSKISPGGYAWILPKSDTVANVGTGIPFQNQPITVKKALDSLIHEHPIGRAELGMGKVVRKTAAMVPMSLPGQTVHRNSLLVGDSASQIITHVGGGIPTAIVCGTIAGQVIGSHFTDGSSLAEYETRWKSYILKDLKKSDFIKRTWDPIYVQDERIDRYMGLLSLSEMRKVLRGKPPLKMYLGKMFLGG